VDCPLCFHICLCYQGFQLPEAIEILFTHTHTHICFYFIFNSFTFCIGYVGFIVNFAKRLKLY
jgi:hypothetical protein